MRAYYEVWGVHNKYADNSIVIVGLILATSPEKKAPAISQEKLTWNLRVIDMNESQK